MLRRIIDTVTHGDPFIAANADRLRNMGWLLIMVNLLLLPLPYLADAVSRLLNEPVTGGADGVSGNGILLALLLFILARVFRKGTEMRADLEGTV